MKKIISSSLQRIRSRLAVISRGLSGRMMLLVLSAILAYTVVLALLLFFGIGQLLASWHARETESLHVFMKNRLSSLAIESRRNGKASDEIETARALEGLPYRPSWIVVTSPDGALLYFYREADIGGQARNFLRRIQDITDWHEVRLSDGSLVFRYSLLVPTFGEQESNRILLVASRMVLVWGCVIAALLAFVFALIFSRPLKAQSSVLVSSLERMASGERAVTLPKCYVSEFEHIATAFGILQKTLVDEEVLRRQWAADIAHDLRTPLSVLRGQLEGIEDGVFTPDAARLARLGNEIHKLESLVNSLALLSRIESPGFTPEQQDVNVADILNSVASRFAPLAETLGTSISVVVADDQTPSVIRADPSLLDRVLTNLVDNALRHGQAGIPVVLAFSGKELAVQNGGVIADEHIPFLFDRLYRGDRARSGEGSGLGLSIVKAIADAQGWTVSVESRADSNRTRFVVGFT